jgi:hypothetical protein
MRRPVFHALLVLSLAPSGVFAQAENAGLNVFGYFQVALGYQKDVQTEREQNSFTLQQLNLFLQKKLTQDWTAFVNFEFVNSYSSFFNWGAFSLEEAWINYQRSDQFKLKLGLLTPAFNNLNELKNRTPLLPYVIRPVVYESSFREIIPTEDFVPARAFMQAYGIIPAGDTKLDMPFIWAIVRISIATATGALLDGTPAGHLCWAAVWAYVISSSKLAFPLPSTNAI